jgi:Flp pilus assembly secretin CpaC
MRRNTVLLHAAVMISAMATKAALAVEPPAPQPPAPIAPSIDNLAAKRALLEEKLAELARLQIEVDALRAATRTPSMIVVHVELLEVSRTKMRRLGLDVEDLKGRGFTPARFDTAAKEAEGTIRIESGPGVEEFIKALKENGVAKTLAEPTIATVSGRRSVIRVGGEFPMPVPPESAEVRTWGTELDVLAEALGNNRVRLNLRLELSEPSGDDASKPMRWNC